MKSSPTALALLALLALPTLFLGCNQTSRYDSMSGEEIFRLLCSNCHGTEGRAMTGVANSYVGKHDLWTEGKLLQFIDNPQGYRPQVPHLMKGQKRYMPSLSRSVPPEARKRLVAHVLQQMAALDLD